MIIELKQEFLEKILKEYFLASDKAPKEFEISVLMRDGKKIKLV